jgi:FKBP-type peptidyl-prolyl cis-trans isomerase
MKRAMVMAVAACVALAACEESKSPAMSEILSAEKMIETVRAEALKASMDFLAKKEAEGGWTKTPSGILYKWVRRNSADTPKPTAESQVLAYYHGTLPNGEVFDSAYQRGQPAGFGLQQVVRGWTEILQLMKIDETVDVILPPALSYGVAGRPPSIGPNQALQFRIELVAFATPDGKITGPEGGRPPLDTPAGVTPDAAPTPPGSPPPQRK